MKGVLVSKCLLGDNVRYDGDHCKLRQDYLSRLKSKFELFPICPEVMAGLGVPREPIELKNNLIIDQVGNDKTSLFTPVKMELEKLIQEKQIKYALLKEFSPSCGSNKIYDGTFSGKIIDGQGIITKFLLDLGLEIFSEEEIEELLNEQ